MDLERIAAWDASVTFEQDLSLQTSCSRLNSGVLKVEVGGLRAMVMTSRWGWWAVWGGMLLEGGFGGIFGDI